MTAITGEVYFCVFEKGHYVQADPKLTITNLLVYSFWSKKLLPACSLFGQASVFFAPSKTDWKSLVTRRKKSRTTRNCRLIVVQYTGKVQIRRKKGSLCQNKRVVIGCVNDLQFSQPLLNCFALHLCSLHIEFCKSLCLGKSLGRVCACLATSMKVWA